MSTTKRKVTLAELATLAGSTVGTSAPHEVSQRRIQAFADATEDHQWIHVDPARASTDGSSHRRTTRRKSTRRGQPRSVIVCRSPYVWEACGANGTRTRDPHAARSGQTQ